MLSNPTTRKAWLETFFNVIFLLAISNVAVGYSAQVHNVNSVVASCALSMSSALVLLLIGGYGPLGKETMRSIDTWLYGLVLILGYILFFSLFSYVSSTEGTLLQRSSILVSLMGGWFFLARKPNAIQILGGLAVLAGVIWLCMGLPNENRSTVVLLLVLLAVIQAARLFASELHRPHTQAARRNDARSKCRVVGFVMFTVGTIFVLTVLFFSWIKHQSPSPLLNAWPDLADFAHAPSIIAGTIIGIVITAPIRYFEFSAAEKIKAENYLAAASLTPISTFFWEWATQPITGMSLHSLSTSDIIAGLVITAGGFSMAFSKMRGSHKLNVAIESYLAKNVQNPDQVEDSREIVANALEHFSGDTQEAAKALNIPAEVIQVMLADREHIYAFKDTTLQEVTRLYRRNVAAADALTGLANRGCFMAALKAALHNQAKLAVLFIDLDKFKPVNDTYGHEAGDLILKEVAKRLQTSLPKTVTISRLGGDEFAIMLPNTQTTKAAQLATKLKTAIAQPYRTRFGSIKITASIGVATAPLDGKTFETLLAAADQRMYAQK